MINEITLSEDSTMELVETVLYFTIWNKVVKNEAARLLFDIVTSSGVVCRRYNSVQLLRFIFCSCWQHSIVNVRTNIQIIFIERELKKQNSLFYICLQVRVVWATWEWVFPALFCEETQHHSTAAGTWMSGRWRR